MLYFHTVNTIVRSERKRIYTERQILLDDNAKEKEVDAVDSRGDKNSFAKIGNDRELGRFVFFYFKRIGTARVFRKKKKKKKGEDKKNDRFDAKRSPRVLFVFYSNEISHASASLIEGGQKLKEERKSRVP